MYACMYIWLALQPLCETQDVMLNGCLLLPSKLLYRRPPTPTSTTVLEGT